ncbi:Pyruvate kinase [Streptococcus mitis]|uniref:Pyruvate kinase n=1 Tax=Streptococcus mitis TaxID=28037 RepID=A0A150NIA1_STRMT|nr:Pyruvate kinase [Streptococcus mitis]
MNKRVKIVATLGPAVEIRGGKKFGDDGYWGEKLDVEASAKNIAKLIEAGANTFRFNFSHGDHQEQGDRMATVKLAEKLAGKKLVSFLILKVQKSVLNCLKEIQKSTLTQLVKKSVLQLNRESNQLVM